MNRSKELIRKRGGINTAIVLLTASDIFTWGLQYGINSLIGIYLAGKLGANASEFVGIGIGINLGIRGLLQIPLGSLTDRIKTQWDETLMLMVGNALMGVVFLLYPYVTTPSFYYVLQFIFGIATSMNLVAWRKLFTINLDEDKEGFEYGLYETVMSLSSSLFSVIIGAVSSLGPQYFDVVVNVIGVLMAGSAVWPILIYLHKRGQYENSLKPKKKVRKKISQPH